MTKKQFDTAYRALCRRRPFRAFLIEFTSGAQLRIYRLGSVCQFGHIAACPGGMRVMGSASPPLAGMT